MGWPGWWGRVLGAVAAGATCAFAEPGPPFDASAPASYLIDAPTAGLPPHGIVEARAAVFPGGGVEVRVDAGLLDRVEVGMGFGGMKMIGDGQPDWYPRPGFALRARVLEESWTMPAISVGVDTRGGGFFDDDRDRFQFKSRGIFAVASKNYELLGDLALHGGVSRSLETEDDGDPTAFGGLDKSLGERAGIAVEYDLATNDDARDGVYGRGRGYLNAALRLRPAPQLELRLVVRDMLQNSERSDTAYGDVIADEGFGREISLTWTTAAF